MREVSNRGRGGSRTSHVQIPGHGQEQKGVLSLTREYGSSHANGTIIPVRYWYSYLPRTCYQVLFHDLGIIRK